MRPSDGPLLSVSSLERAFGARRALAGVSFSVQAGEAVLLAGPNGAGKTTLLRCLAGLSRPTRGEVRVAGTVVRSSAPDSRRPIGYVAHQTLLHVDLTLLENLTFTARLYGLTPADAHARAALEGAGLAARRDDLPRALSRGMQQRAAIARALLHQPSVLLLDEPFTGLDAAAAESLRTALAEARAAGSALLLVTHQPEEAWTLATRVIGLASGRMVFDEPRHGEVAGLRARMEAMTRG